MRVQVATKNTKREKKIGTYEDINLETNELKYEGHCLITLTEANKSAILFCDVVSQQNLSHFSPEKLTSGGRSGFLVTPS